MASVEMLGFQHHTPRPVSRHQAEFEARRERDTFFDLAKRLLHRLRLKPKSAKDRAAAEATLEECRRDFPELYNVHDSQDGIINYAQQNYWKPVNDEANVPRYFDGYELSTVPDECYGELFALEREEERKLQDIRDRILRIQIMRREMKELHEKKVQVDNLMASMVAATPPPQHQRNIGGY